MRRFGTGLVTVVLILIPAAALAANPDDTPEKLGWSWLARMDPSSQIPADLALHFGHAAISAGLTKGQAAAMLNDNRFTSALGSPDQGYGMLEAMIDHPVYIPKAQALLANHNYSAAGADSLQNAIMGAVPELRNAYLKDLGLMAVKGPAGVLVLVDIETGRQVIGQGRLGTQLRAPGGGPLPKPAVSPEEAAAQMWAQAAAVSGPRGPGFNFSTDDRPGFGLAPAIGESHGRGLLTPGVYLVGLSFVIAWGGYAVASVIRRMRVR